MAYWSVPLRNEGVDREPSFYWNDFADDRSGDGSSDFFGQFVDFGSDNPAVTSGVAHPEGLSLADTLILQPPESTDSSGLSPGDEFDFLSSSSQAGPPFPAVSHDVDPTSLAIKSEHHPLDATSFNGHQHLDYMGANLITEGDLSRLESISLQSPVKEFPVPVQVAQPASPSPTRATQRKPKRFVEAISSTIRKATNIRRGRRDEEQHHDPPHRAVSPTMDNPPMALKQRPPGLARAVTGRAPESLPKAPFVHGVNDDPFMDMPSHPQGTNMRYFTHHGLSTPAESPAMAMLGNNGSSESAATVTAPHVAHGTTSTSWPLPEVPLQHSASGTWTPRGHEYLNGHTAGWWDLNLIGHPGSFGEHKEPIAGTAGSHHHISQHQLQQQHLQQQEDHNMHQYNEYHDEPVTDASQGGLMISMPQPQPPQSTVVRDLSLTAQTYLPPPPTPATERPHRPPRAPSSGARHRNLSTSPVRRNRGPSASPTPAGQSSRRHSSGGSISSGRSASGRLPGSMPGTPCSVRKNRRSRDVSNGSASVAAAAAAAVSAPGSAVIGSTGSSSCNEVEIGNFVNFTPDHGSLLMTGVAPSGSSKTKARREKEAQERRRKLSEAAIKAVAAAGGDVDKLAEHGFAF